MQTYIARRLLQTVYVVIALSVVIFFVMRLVPGDPAVMRLGKEATVEALEEERRALGLDKPIHTQYFIWVRNIMRGDFGVSWISHQPALNLVWEKFKRTVPLAVSATLVGLLIARSARHRQESQGLHYLTDHPEPGPVARETWMTVGEEGLEVASRDLPDPGTT